MLGPVTGLGRQRLRAIRVRLSGCFPGLDWRCALGFRGALGGPSRDRGAFLRANRLQTHRRSPLRLRLGDGRLALGCRSLPIRPRQRYHLKLVETTGARFASPTKFAYLFECIGIGGIGNSGKAVPGWGDRRSILSFRFGVWSLEFGVFGAISRNGQRGWERLLMIEAFVVPASTPYDALDP